MNMNKALQNLYHAVSNETTTKVNISKLLVDIHYAITGKESENKNNWSKIVNSMADNWPEGGGGSSDFSTAEVTLAVSTGTFENEEISNVVVIEDDALVTGVHCADGHSNSHAVLLYKGIAYGYYDGSGTVTVTGDITYDDGDITITGDGTITIS